jgi:tyrosyl-tRNA synthetase
MRIFTFLSRSEMAEYETAVAEEPFKRAAQRRLAHDVTSLVHGIAATEAAIAAAGALFGQGDLALLDAVTLEAALRELPNTTTTSNTPVAQLLVDTGLSASLGAARRSIAEGGVYLNNQKVAEQDALLESSILPSRMAVLRRGKKTLAGVFVE